MQNIKKQYLFVFLRRIMYISLMEFSVKKVISHKGEIPCFHEEIYLSVNFIKNCAAAKAAEWRFICPHQIPILVLAPSVGS